MESKGAAPLMVLMAATLWGMIGLVTRSLDGLGFSSLQTTESRCIVAVAVFGAAILLMDRRQFRIELRDIWMFIGTGLCSVALFNAMYFAAQQMIPLSVAAVLLYTAPCFVMILSVAFLKEMLTPGKIVSLAMAFAGCVLTAGIIGGGGAFNATGIALGVGAGFCYALYSIFGKFALKKYSSLTVTFYTFVIALLCLAPVSDIPGIASTVSADTDALLLVLCLGIVMTVLPYIFYTKGLNGMDAGKASIIAFLEPMVATVVGFAAFGEQPTVMSLSGIALILVSIMLLNAGSMRRMPFGRSKKE